MSEAEHYPGEELKLFQEAVRWKSYLANQITPFLRGDVLEVGAGLGATTRVLHRPNCKSWTCLEPDLKMGQALPDLVGDLHSENGESPHVVVATLSKLAGDALYDVILYIDVLEHIEDDRSELRLALDRLKPGGRIVVLSPAMQWLYTPFDESIGHFRRYTKRSLRAVAPSGLEVVAERYLDVVGITASLANRLLMRKTMPTIAQIHVWDRYMVPISRLLDPLLFYKFGKSVLLIFEK